jgi:hypothetical protein
MSSQIRLLVLFLGSALILSGCGGADETEATTETEMVETPPVEVVQEEPEQSTTDTLVMQQFDVQESLTASDKAAQNQDWQGATDNLLKLQLSGSIKSVEDSWKYNQRMTALQSQLIEAADRGDPKAQAAIDLLRRSRRVR